MGWSRRPKLVLDSVGLLIAAALFAASLSLSSPVQNVTTGVAASFVFICVLDLLTASQATLTGRALVRFFGGELARHQLLVYPVFEQHQAARDALSSVDPDKHYDRPSSSFRGLGQHLIEVPMFAATNDITALLYISAIFDGGGGQSKEIRVDTDVVMECDRSFVSIGLNSNDCTLLYTNTIPNPLFRVVKDESMPLSSYIELRDGRRFQSTPDTQYAVILRHAPDPVHYPQRRWFLCGGLGAAATPAAGWYLLRHWKTLARQVRRRADFVAILRTNTYTDKNATLEHVLVASAAGDPFVKAPRRSAGEVSRDAHRRPTTRYPGVGVSHRSWSS